MNEWLVNIEDLPKSIVKFKELLCGCGQPAICWDYLHEFLKTRDNDTPYKNTENALELFFMYVVDNCGMTEHGTSIYGAWLTEEGKTALSWLNENTDKLDDFVIGY